MFFYKILKILQLKWVSVDSEQKNLKPRYVLGDSKQLAFIVLIYLS